VSRIDFYVLSEEAPDARLRFACRLAEKAVEQGQHVYLRTESADETRRLDDLLWSFNDRGFLPHEIARPAIPPPHSRVMIMLGEGDAPTSHRQLLVNLSATPADTDNYERVAEIVDIDPERKRLARERYKQYRERGCTLESHNV
jgi:DNA polymerase III subunit chi